MSDDTEPGTDPTHTRAVDRVEGAPASGQPPLHADDLPEGIAPEDLEDEVGAEGGSQSPNHHTPTPFHPTRDGTALGDTDQHSDA